MGRVVLDTSILIALERQALPIDSVLTPTLEVFVPEVAIAEFLVGIELTNSAAHKLRRLAFLQTVEAFSKPVHFDRAHAHNFAKLVAQSKVLGKPRGSIDLAIAASAVTLDAVLYTSDVKGRFDQLIGLAVKEF